MHQLCVVAFIFHWNNSRYFHGKVIINKIDYSFMRLANIWFYEILEKFDKTKSNFSMKTYSFYKDPRPNRPLTLQDGNIIYTLKDKSHKAPSHLKWTYNDRTKRNLYTLASSASYVPSDLNIESQSRTESPALKKPRKSWSKPQESTLLSLVSDTQLLNDHIDWSTIALKWNDWNKKSGSKDVRMNKQLSTKYSSLIRRQSMSSTSTSSVVQALPAVNSMNAEESDSVILEESATERSYIDGNDSIDIQTSSLIDIGTSSLPLRVFNQNSLSILVSPRERQPFSREEIDVITSVFNLHFPNPKDRVDWSKFHREWIKEASQRKERDLFLELYCRTEKALKQKVKDLRKKE